MLTPSEPHDFSGAGGPAGADAAAPEVAPCPCRLLFPFGLEVPPWWTPRPPPHQGVSARALPEVRESRWLPGSRGFECVPGWKSWTDPLAAVACRAVEQLLEWVPSRQVVRTAGDLYSLGRVHLTEVQHEALQSQTRVAVSHAVRQSRDHVVLSGEEIHGSSTDLFRVPQRLVVLVLSGDELSFLASSAPRRARFCRWLRHLEAQYNPLALVSGVPLVEQTHARPQPPQRNKLTFRSTRRGASAAAPSRGLLDVFEAVDQDELLMLLAEGGQRIESWRRAVSLGQGARGTAEHLGHITP